ncbi:MAG TPA: alpha/beta fold hydrolase [Nocardioidaceae bacterium]|nr:alpha/beta fold hydrolase [Nocardioidaceae bacterium]
MEHRTLFSVTSRLLILGFVAAVLAVLVHPGAPGSLTHPRPAHAAAAAPILAAHNDTSTPFNLVSMPALIRHEYHGRGLRTRVITEGPDGTEYAVRYRSDGLTITGVMAVPRGSGPFPVVVLAHGFHTPTAYAVAPGVVAERDWLVRRGYLVLQPDYRNYGGSTRESRRYVARPTGYPADLVNAVLALRRARLPYVARGPVNVFGRSMGGGVALQAIAAYPSLFRAAVLSSPLSSRAADNFRRWVRSDPALRARVVDAYGPPRSNPAFWRAASVRHYLSRVSVPVQLHHGTADATCPVAWSEVTTRALRRQDKRVALFEYSGQPHRFHAAAWRRMMQRTVRFFEGARAREG